jgi:uncharacterized protein YfaS (alpha-2-macroglobulin family)
MTRMNSVVAMSHWLRSTRRRSALILATLLAAIALAATSSVAFAGDDASSSAAAAESSIAANPTLNATPTSNYSSQKVDGQPFFLLSDASFGSNQTAQVRLEAPGRDFKDALQPYGGADIVVYRVGKPLDFLKAQKNLHRLNVAPNYQGEGLANTLAYFVGPLVHRGAPRMAACAFVRDPQQGNRSRAAIQARRANRQADAI